MGTRKNRQSLRRSKKGGGKWNRRIRELQAEGQGMLSSLVPPPPSPSGTHYEVKRGVMTSSSEPAWCQTSFLPTAAACSQCPSLHSRPGSACRRDGGGKSRKRNKRNKRKSQRRNKKQRKN